MDETASSQIKLERLQRWLTLEGSSAVAFLVLLAGVPFIPVILLLSVAALIFTPYLLFVLFRTGHRGWMVGFAVMVGTPYLLWLLPVSHPVLTVVVRLLPLFMFYLYCWLLRLAVGEWIES